ncbi:MAG TPA: amidohydrolase family protein [Candidatus Saccharimonadia bacterium]|nr:amidohydrolase family protein [Candidatus Saccharimonadia bacterium]
MQIVDSQIHLWENATMSPQHRQIPTYSMDDALQEMTEAGVDAAVIHPPSTLGEAMNALAVDAARQHPDTFCILGNFDLQSPDRLDIVKHWRQRPGMLGFRFTFNQPHQQRWWTDGSLDWFWAACEQAGLPIGLLAGGHMADLGTIAAHHPGLKLHIDHCGRGGGGGGGTDEAAFANLGEMLALATYPNVAVKLSGAPSYSSHPYPYRNIHPYRRQIFDAFGPQRCFWGTDITRMPCSYRQCVTMFTEELSWLQGRDKELVMGDAICDWLGWRRPR